MTRLKQHNSYIIIKWCACKNVVTQKVAKEWKANPTTAQAAKISRVRRKSLAKNATARCRRLSGKKKNKQTNKCVNDFELTFDLPLLRLLICKRYLAKNVKNANMYACVYFLLHYYNNSWNNHNTIEMCCLIPHTFITQLFFMRNFFVCFFAENYPH